ncbi:transposable element Tc1 transposase [Trichonephila clavipes]|nr:transposable element Tc1 transposase [Trichonephila clavipes]
MPPRRNKKKFQQHTESERGRIICLREGGFFYRTKGVRVQRNSSTVMRVWKQWTDEHRTNRKTGSGRRKVTSARDDRHLLHRGVNDRTASSRQLAAHWSTVTGVLISVSSIHRRLLHRGLHESRFNLWDHDGCIRVRRYASERCHPECVIERRSSLTPEVMIWDAISCHGRSNLLLIEGIPGAIFQHDDARPHVVKTVRDFCSSQRMQLLPWPAYSPDISPTEHVWDLVGRRLARDPRPSASKDELLLRTQAIWNSLPQADIQYLFNSMPLHV